MEEITFLGVSDETMEQAEKTWKNYESCCKMYEVLDKFCKRNFNMSRVELDALMVKTLKEYGESLKKVEEEAALPSEKESVRNYLKAILSFNNLAETVGDGLLNMVTEEGAEELADDKGVKTIINACLFNQ